MCGGDDEVCDSLPLPFSLSPPPCAGDEVVVWGKRRALVQRITSKGLRVTLHDGTAVTVGHDDVSLLRTIAEIRRDADLAQVNKRTAPALRRIARCENMLMRPIDVVSPAASPVIPRRPMPLPHPGVAYHWRVTLF